MTAMSGQNYQELPHVGQKQGIAAQNSWLNQWVGHKKIPHVISILLYAENLQISSDDLSWGHIYLQQLRNWQSDSSQDSRLSDAFSLSQQQARPFSGSSDSTYHSQYSISSGTTGQTHDCGRHLSYSSTDGQHWCTPEAGTGYQPPPRTASLAHFPFSPHPVPQETSARGRTANTHSKLPHSNDSTDGGQRSRSRLSMQGKSKAQNPHICFCFACNRNFTRLDDLHKHMHSSCDKLRERQDNFECDFCTSNLKKDKYFEHVKSHFGKKCGNYCDLRLKMHHKTNPILKQALEMANGQVLQDWSSYNWDISRDFLRELEEELKTLPPVHTVLHNSHLVSLCEELLSRDIPPTSIMDFD